MPSVSFDKVLFFMNIRTLELAIDGIQKRRHHINNNTTFSQDKIMVAVKFILNSTFFFNAPPFYFKYVDDIVMTISKDKLSY